MLSNNLTMIVFISQMTHIDLNSDLGESFGPWMMGDDAAMLDIVTSANIACGFHAGDPAGILRVLENAARRGVAVGAHVGYRDLVGFGRRDMEPSDAELTADTIYQIGALQGLAHAAGTRVTYVKPHGALYNTIAHDARQARAVIDAIQVTDPSLILMALAGAPVVGWARAAGLKVVCEAFADRAYNPNGSLVGRGQAGAVLHDPDLIALRMVQLVTKGSIPAIDGTEIFVDAQSICIHGDTPAAVSIARAVKDALRRHGLTLTAFTNV